jgi:hypothetical protein
MDVSTVLKAISAAATCYSKAPTMPEAATAQQPTGGLP